jgi:rhodanese-related sulfurtransferase
MGSIEKLSRPLDRPISKHSTSHKTDLFLNACVIMIRFIGAKVVGEKLQLGEKPVLLDITSELSYQKQHPKSAINIPVERLKDPKISHSFISNAAQEIIIFAENFETEPAWEAAELLHRQGFDNLFIYEGGKAKWVEDGLSFQAVHYPPRPPESPDSRKDKSPKDRVGKDSAA